MRAFLFVKFDEIIIKIIRLIRVIGLRRAEGSWLRIIPSYFYRYLVRSFQLFGILEGQLLENGVHAD